MIKITDEKKIRRIIALLAVFAMLLLFEISYVAMTAYTAKLPAKTEAVKGQTAELQEENKKIDEESAEYGDYEQLTEQNDSWLRLKTKLEGSE